MIYLHSVKAKNIKSNLETLNGYANIPGRRIEELTRLLLENNPRQVKILYTWCCIQKAGKYRRLNNNFGV